MKRLYVIIFFIIIISIILCFNKFFDKLENFNENKINFIENELFDPDEDFGYIIKKSYPIDNIREYEE